MNDDIVLLRRYVSDRSEAAFTELVRRHIGLVRATALRRVWGDAHLADDVTQAVFISLARKAPVLLEHGSLAGWLYLATQLASAEVVRSEQRRKVRETTAHHMNTPDASDLPAVDLAQLRRLLDDGLIALRDDDREAVLLRFFQQRSFAEIGAALRITEEAARKRVDRSLDKLHDLLGRRGITSSVSALGVALTAVGAGVMSEGLVTRVAGAALTHAAGGAASVTAAGVTGTWPPLAAAAAVMVGAAALLTQQHANEALVAEVAQLERQNAAISALQADNNRVARSVAETNARPVAKSTVAPRIAQVTTPPVVVPSRSGNVVTLTPEGAVAWEGKVGMLDDYLAQLVALREGSPDGESSLVIQADGGRFRQMLWVLDEARKAGIRHIKVQSDAKLDPKAPGMWF